MSKNSSTLLSTVVRLLEILASILIRKKGK
jgi:hypothetical protein